MFKEKLYNIYERFQKIPEEPEKLIQRRIQQKLDMSLENYYENLASTIEFLLSKNSITILKGYLKTFGGNDNDKY